MSWVEGRDHGLRRPESETFAARLTRVLAERERSLTWLRRRLAERGHSVSLATLSYWRRGRREPERAASLDAVEAIEEILDLQRGELKAAIGPSRRNSPSESERPDTAQDIDMLAGQAVDHGLAELGLALGQVAEGSIHLTVDVDAAGRERRLTSRALIRATRDGVRRVPIGMIFGVPTPDALRFEALAGAQVGRVHHNADHGVHLAELVLDRELRMNESALVEHRIELGDGIPSQREYHHYLMSRVHEFTLWVRFARLRPATHCEAYQLVDGEETTSPVDMHGATSAHLVLRGFGPGTAGLRWAW